MNTKQVLTTSQEQAAAAWIDYLNQARLNDLLARLSAQNINTQQALQELENLKRILAEELIGKNRGGEKGLHGFIAEATEVAIENARKLIVGAKPECVWLNDNGPADILRGNTEIQQKFVEAGGAFSLNAIKEHAEKYPDFTRSGGVYQIPKNHYEIIKKLLAMTEEEAGKLPSKGNGGINYAKWKWVQRFFQESGIKPEDIEPAVTDYSDVQANQIGKTIQKEADSLKKTDRERQKAAYEASKPTLEEGAQAAGVSAALEGGTAFCLGVYQKLKSGKQIAEFTGDDWAELGIAAGKGAVKGGIRGGTVYAMTNFTATPAPVANALVTAAFGVAGQANQLRQGMISEEDFLINSQVVCLDATVSAVASLLGQTLIPIPVLGAIVGNTVGMLLYGIAKENLSAREQELIQSLNAQMDALNRRLAEEYLEFVRQLQAEFEKFASVLAMAFDRDVNLAFAGSAALAEYVGVPAEQILYTQKDIQDYFTK